MNDISVIIMCCVAVAVGIACSVIGLSRLSTSGNAPRITFRLISVAAISGMVSAALINV